MVEKWLSISQLSDATGIPETTVRRYTNKFNKYFRAEKRGKGRKYHPEAVEIVTRIATLYQDDFQASDIDKILSQDFAFNVEDEAATTQPPVKSMEQQFESFKAQQEQFNASLLQELHNQQKYIRETLERRDREIMQVMNDMQEAKKEIAATKHRKWWQFWKVGK